MPFSIWLRRSEVRAFLALLVLLVLLITAPVDAARKTRPTMAILPLPPIPHYELPSLSEPEAIKPPRYIERQTPNNIRQNQEYEGQAVWRRIVAKTVDDPVALFTLVLAVSTIGLWIVTWRSGVRQSKDTRLLIAENRRAADQQSGDMQRSIRVSRLTAMAAVRQSRSTTRLVGASDQHVELFQSSLYDLQRAYMLLKNILPIDIAQVLLRAAALPGTPLYPSVTVTVKNYGKTPGNIQSVGIVIEIAAAIPAFLTVETVPQHPVVGAMQPEVIEIVIGEYEEYLLGSFQGSDTQFSSANIREINTGNLSIYCHGWFRYIDIFMHPHDTVFCRRYSVTGRDFVPVGGMERNHSN
jgi:hypothetical protein